jgi:hypothetical protein
LQYPLGNVVRDEATLAPGACAGVSQFAGRYLLQRQQRSLTMRALSLILFEQLSPAPEPLNISGAGEIMRLAATAAATTLITTRVVRTLGIVNMGHELGLLS